MIAFVAPRFAGGLHEMVRIIFAVVKFQISGIVQVLAEYPMIFLPSAEGQMANPCLLVVVIVEHTPFRVTRRFFR